MFMPRPLTETEQALEDACAARSEIGTDEAQRIAAEVIAEAAQTAQRAGLTSDDFEDAAAVGAVPIYAPNYTPAQVATAIARARTVTSIIVHHRDAVSRGRHNGAQLASYDAELSRLVRVPGVMAALLDDMDAEWRAQDQAESSDENL